MGNYWQEGDTVGFSRGNKGYYAMAKFGSLDKTVQTGEPIKTNQNSLTLFELTFKISSEDFLK
jgi:hypothetical protein